MSDHLVAEVAEHARRGRIVPFAGAGVSLGVLDRAGARLFPGWHELLERSEAQLDGRPERHLVRGFLETGNLLEAARYAAKGLGPRWADLLREALKPLRDAVDDASLALPRALWELGSQVVVTTNYDRVLQWACPQPDDVDRWNIEAPAELVAMAQGRLDRPAIWHLHGKIEVLEDLILTPEGYATLYPSTVNEGLKQRFDAAHAALKSLFVSHCFLFVGFSFADDHFTDQLAWVQDTFSQFTGPHYALVHRSEMEAVQTRLDGRVRIELIGFEDFGPPMVALLKRMRPTTEAPSASNAPGVVSDLSADDETGAGRSGIGWPARVQEVVNELLARPTQPLIFFGPRDCGRTTLLSDVVEALRPLEATHRVARVDFDMLPDSRRDTLGETLRYVMGRVASVLDTELPSTFAQDPESTFPTAVEEVLKALGEARLVLCIDDFDVALAPYPEVAVAFFAQLRGLAVRAKSGSAPMDRLSMILTARHLQRRHLDTESSPLPGIAKAMPVHPISSAELNTYAASMGVTVEARDITRMLDDTAGHPPLLRALVEHAAAQTAKMRTLLLERHGLYDEYIDRQRRRLERMQRRFERDMLPLLRTEIRMQKVALSHEERAALVELGVLRDEQAPGRLLFAGLEAILS